MPNYFQLVKLHESVTRGPRWDPLTDVDLRQVDLGVGAGCPLLQAQQRGKTSLFGGTEPPDPMWTSKIDWMNHVLKVLGFVYKGSAG